MKQVVGLDLSISASGVCIASLEDPFRITSLTTINTKAVRVSNKIKYSVSLEERTDQILEQLEFLGVFTDSVLVFIEGFAFGQRQGRLTQLAQSQGIVRYALYKRGISNVRAIAPSTLKKHATGKGTGEKSAILVHSDRKYREALSEFGISMLVDNDQADALNLCHMAWTYYLAKQGKAVTKQTKELVALIDKQGDLADGD